MKFSASLADFQKVLQRVIPAIPPKSTLPVLEHLHLTLTEGSLRIIATDQDITIMSNMDVQSLEIGSILVPARKINDIIRALEPKGSFEFSCSPETFDIKIKTEKGNYSMKGLDPNEYLALPELFESEKPNIEELTSPEPNRFMVVLSETDAVRLATRTVFAVSNDEFRPAMTGVLFQFRQNYINTVATDSYRLSRCTCFSDRLTYPEPVDVIIPARMVEMIKKIDEEVVISLIEANEKTTHIRFDFGNTIMISRVINEKFPPYEAVLPQNNDIHILLDQKELLAAVRRVSIFANMVSKQVRLRFAENTITFLSEDEESGYQGKESMPCDYSGDEFEVAFNFKYLEEMVQNIDHTETEGNLITFMFGESNKPVLLKPKNEKDILLMLIMPVRSSQQS